MVVEVPNFRREVPRVGVLELEIGRIRISEHVFAPDRGTLKKSRCAARDTREQFPGINATHRGKKLAASSPPWPLARAEVILGPFRKDDRVIGHLDVREREGARRWASQNKASRAVFRSVAGTDEAFL